MASVTVQLPADLAEQIHVPDLSREVTLVMAMNLFREGTVSLGRAAELSSLPLADFMDLCAQHGIPIVRYTSQDLDQERESLIRLGF